MQAMPDGWKVIDGILLKEVSTEVIVTLESFADFELTLDWKLGPGGNSGLFYRGTEEYNRVYWSAVEYQLLDDSLARDGRNRITAAGAAHSLYPGARRCGANFAKAKSGFIVIQRDHQGVLQLRNIKLRPR